MRIGQQSVQRGFALLSHGATLTTAMHHLSRGDTFARLRDDMIASYYETLVSLGYDAEKLKS